MTRDELRKRVLGAIKKTVEGPEPTTNKEAENLLSDAAIVAVLNVVSELIPDDQWVGPGTEKFHALLSQFNQTTEQEE